MAKGAVPKKRGRKKVKAGDKRVALPVYAKKKHHPVLKQQLQPIADEIVAKIESNEQ